MLAIMQITEFDKAPPASAMRENLQNLQQNALIMAIFMLR
jgi:hypothetical protein